MHGYILMNSTHKCGCEESKAKDEEKEAEEEEEGKQVPVVFEVTFHQVTGSQCGHETQLPGQDGGTNDGCQLLGVGAGVPLIGPPDSQHLTKTIPESFIHSDCSTPPYS